MKDAANSREFKDGKPAVSIVIPVYNAADYISKTVNSVFAQTVACYELIIVNDGSPDTDRLEQALQPYLPHIVYLKQENRGVSAARNAGISVAGGAFYAQLDADDLWEPEYLAKQLAYLEHNPMIDLVYPNALIFCDGSNESIEFMKVCPSHGEPTFERLVRQQCTVMTSVTARMEAMKRTGLFDETLPGCEDFDLWLRFIKRGGRIGYHREILARYRRRPDGLSSDRAWMTSNLLRVLDKAQHTLQLTPSELIAVQQESVRRRAMLHLFQGKKALAHGDTATAIELVSKANSLLRSGKLSFTLWALRHWPRFVNFAFNVRRRWFSRSDKYILTGLD